MCLAVRSITTAPRPTLERAGPSIAALERLEVVGRELTHGGAGVLGGRGVGDEVVAGAVGRVAPDVPEVQEVPDLVGRGAAQVERGAGGPLGPERAVPDDDAVRGGRRTSASESWSSGTRSSTPIALSAKPTVRIAARRTSGAGSLSSGTTFSKRPSSLCSGACIASRAALARISASGAVKPCSASSRKKSGCLGGRRASVNSATKPRTGIASPWPSGAPSKQNDGPPRPLRGAVAQSRTPRERRSRSQRGTVLPTAIAGG